MKDNVATENVSTDTSYFPWTQILLKLKDYQEQKIIFLEAFQVFNCI